MAALRLGARRDDDLERTRIMLCYSCAEVGTERPAVALCRGCGAGLCLDHLRATAAHFATSHMLDSCNHDTWTATDAHPRADMLQARGSSA